MIAIHQIGGSLDELSALLAQLSPSDQERVLIFARTLAYRPEFLHTRLSPGTPGHVVAQLHVSPEGGEAMAKALEDTERVWPDEHGVIRPDK